MHKLILILIILTTAVLFRLLGKSTLPSQILEKPLVSNRFQMPNRKSTPGPTVVPFPTLTSKTLTSNYHVFQTFNNCGPASLSMALYYYGVSVSQKILGESLRPYQNSQGDNDDKSVTLPELGEEAKKYDLVPFHRPNGDINLIKRAISAGFPVITRTWLTPSEDIGHYRVIKGFNDQTQEIIQDDSLQGKNISYKYSYFDQIWEKFNYEFLLLVPRDKAHIVESILLDNFDEDIAWAAASSRSEKTLDHDPGNIYARFNYSVALYHTGNYKKSVEEFEKVENRLPFRTLWYQIEPIEAYVKLKNYARVFQITDKILGNHNRAFSELYLIRGDIYREQGKLPEARVEYEKALLYNKNLRRAQEASNF